MALLQATIIYGQDGFVNGKPSLAYWTIGNKQETVIVLHGGPSAAHDYLRPEWDALNSVARVVYYDQRGCGKSGGADCYSWQMHVQDLKRVINAFSPANKVILAGSSWGTTLALLYAYTFPDDVKGLILSGTYPWAGKGIVKKDCSLYQPKISKNTVYKMSLKYGMHVSQQNIKDKQKQDSLEREWKLFESHPYALLATLKSTIDAPALHELQKIKALVLIFQGTGTCDPRNPMLKNTTDGAHQFKGILPSLEVFQIDACHDGWYDNPKEFFKKATSFIQALDQNKFSSVK